MGPAFQGPIHFASEQVIFSWLSLQRRRKALAQTLYDGLVRQARNPYFYERLSVPDTVTGRFEMVVAHVFLLLARLRSEGKATERLQQDIIDTFFADMDTVARELGVGDLAVPKKMKKLASSAYGRFDVYAQAMAMSDGGGALREALGRNIFSDRPGATGKAKPIATYMRRVAAELDATETEQLLQGSFSFPSLREIESME